MNRSTLLIFTKVCFGLFFIGTIISSYIVYKDIDSSIALRFLIGYLILTFFLIFYIPIITIINITKTKWGMIKKRRIKFIIFFVIFVAFNYAFDYHFRPSSMNLLRELSIALGLSFCITFIDIIFLKSNKLFKD